MYGHEHDNKNNKNKNNDQQKQHEDIWKTSVSQHIGKWEEKQNLLSAKRPPPESRPQGRRRMTTCHH